MKQIPKDIQIPVTIGGVTFKNPFFVASGPTTKTVKQLKRIEETGWAAASIKLSIDPAPYINNIDWLIDTKFFLNIITLLNMSFYPILCFFSHSSICYF